MGWQRKLLEDTARQYDVPCPNCCKFRIGPMNKDGSDMRGWVFTDEFQAYIEEEMETKGLLERINADRDEERELLAKRFSEILKKSRGYKDRNGRIKLGHGQHVVKCPKCDGKGRLETKDSKFLRQLAGEQT